MQWQLDWIVALQKAGGLAGPMRVFTFLGNEEFFLALMPLVYLCLNRQLGAQLGFLVLLNDSLNNLLKLAFHLPRPYWVDRRVQPLGVDASYGLPSSHAQNAPAVWFFLAGRTGRRWAWIAAACLVLLISLSRIYLGVHFITDVIGGWLLGSLFLAGFYRLEPAARRWLGGLRIAAQIGVALGAALLLVGCSLVLRAMLAGTADPAAWAARATDGRSLDAITSRAGALFGLGAGLAMAGRWARFDAGGPLGARVARFVVAMIGLLALYIGLHLISPDDPPAVALVFRFSRYALMTWWVSFLAPWLFLKINLAPRRGGEVSDRLHPVPST